MSDFLPQGYEMKEPSSSYMKLEEGRNHFRVLSSAIVGWEYWVGDDKGNRTPVRVKSYFQIPDEVKNRPDRRETPREFWAFAVYNYDAKRIQVLELKQATIMRALGALVHNPKWGTPRDYDLVIDKTKTGSNPYDVEYSVMPEPKEPVDAGIKKTYDDMEVRLEALYEGADPFAGSKEKEGDQIAEDAAKDIR